MADMTDMFEGLDMKPAMDRTFCGPSIGVCAVCGKEIGAYESRRFGNTGAVHIWKPDAIAVLAECLTKENAHLYPHYYTDG